MGDVHGLRLHVAPVGRLLARQPEPEDGSTQAADHCADSRPDVPSGDVPARSFELEVREVVTTDLDSGEQPNNGLFTPAVGAR